MSAVASATTQVNSFQSAESVFKKYQIVIDLDNLTEYCGIAPDEIGISDWMRDKNLKTVRAEDLYQLSEPLEEGKLEGTPPISCTFRCAVRFIVDLINKKSSHSVINVVCEGKGLDFEILKALTNIETKRSDLLPKPPCNAPQDLGHNWIGAIFAMLKDLGHISDYGKRGYDYQVCL